MARKTNKKTKKLLRVKKEIVKKFQERSKKEEIDNKVVDKMKKTKICVIGIGGGGGSIVSEIASHVPKVNFVAANTDLQALKVINKKVNRFPFGQKLTYGLGTGMNVDLGREAAINEKEKIKKLCQGQDICIIVACLGGGTGSGAASIFAKISKSLGNLTYGIFTLPFEFEGDKKMEIAKDALKKIKSHLDAITLIPNERVFQIINKDTPLKQALSVVNKKLTEGLEGLIETIYQPGLINIDFADFKTIFKSKGKIAYLNTIEVSIKEDSVKDLMSQVLNSPLYPYTIQGAKGVLFNISGEKNLSLLEVSQISKSILELVNPEARIIFGTRIRKPSVSEVQRGRGARSVPRPLTNKEPIIKTTLLAIGCELKKSIKKKKKSIIKKRVICHKKDKEEQVIKLKAQAERQRGEAQKTNSFLKIKKLEKLFKKDKSSTKLIKKVKEKEKKDKEDKSSSLVSRFAKTKKEKKIKIKINKKLKNEIPNKTLINEINFKKINPKIEIISNTRVKKSFSSSPEGVDERVRKNGLQIKKDAEDFEKEILEKEKAWEIPAFLRRKSIKLK